MKNTSTQDHDYSMTAVPVIARRSFFTMFMIMLGFTFFSASMWTGQTLGNGLDFSGFVSALLLGGVILGIYTSLLAYIAAKTGLSLDLLTARSFGTFGSYLPSGLIAFTQIGWFGVGVAMFALPVANLIAPDSKYLPIILVAIAGICMTGSAFFGIRTLTIISYISVPLITVLGCVAMYMAVTQSNLSLVEQFGLSSNMSVITGTGLVIGSFVSGGTSTPNFARFAKTPKHAVITTAVAFFIGNSLMFTFGAVSGIYTGGNDIFEVMIALNLTAFAILVLGLNIWTTNDNAIYTAGLGLSNITKIPKSPMVLISGALGTVLSIWLYNNFTNWLNILNCTLPPVGIIVILGYFCHKEDYTGSTKESLSKVNWFSITGVILGAIVAVKFPFGIASINGMIVGALCYLIGDFIQKKKGK